MPSSFQLIAHRGAPMHAPENTLASFETALRQGARAVETDIQLTADGIPVLCHDNVLDRYGHPGQTIGQYDYDALSRLDFGSWHHPDFAGEPILRLEQFLTRFGDAFNYHLELKDDHPETARVTLEMLAATGTHKVVLSSFRLSQLRRVREQDASIPLAWLAKTVSEETWEEARALRLTHLAPKAALIDAALLARAEAEELIVRAWGCPRTEAEARATVERLAATSCVGITVDNLTWFS